MLGLRFDLNYFASAPEFYGSNRFSVLSDLLQDVKEVRKEYNENLLFLTAIQPEKEVEEISEADAKIVEGVFT